jgi:hypothetical protein
LELDQRALRVRRAWLERLLLVLQALLLLALWALRVLQASEQAWLERQRKA